MKDINVSTLIIGAFERCLRRHQGTEMAKFATEPKFLLAVFAGLSELERNLIKDRTEEGRISARKRGVKFDRKPKLTIHQQSEVARMLKQGQSIRYVARHFNVGVATIDRIKNVQTDPH